MPSLDEPDRTLMWFGDSTRSNPSAIGLKVSYDHGRTWSSSTSYSLVPTDNGADKLGASAPSVVRFGDYYYLAYQDLSPLFQSGAHDGFHEAIGDTIALSITPAYLAQIGLIDKVTFHGALSARNRQSYGAPQLGTRQGGFPPPSTHNRKRKRRSRDE